MPLDENENVVPEIKQDKWRQAAQENEVLEQRYREMYAGVVENKDIGSVSVLDTEEGELQEAYEDYDVSITTDLEGMRQQRAENQSTWEQAGRSIVGGAAKGVLTAVENIGYLVDVPNYFAMESMDDAMGNGLVQLAKAGKESIDDNFAIYTKNPGKTWDFSDSGWVFQQLQGLVDSAVGFGLTGAGAGAIIGKGASALANATKLGLITENVIQSVGTGIATNYVESRMMSLDLYKNVYDNALSKGKTIEEAENLAAEEAHDFVWKNKTGIATDAFTYGNIISGKSLISGGKKATTEVKEGLIKKLSAGGSQFVKEAIGESYEEISAGFLQKEGERSAAMKLDGKTIDGDEYESDDTTAIGRAARYAISEEGLLEGALGILGGPTQSLATRALVKAKEARSPKVDKKAAEMDEQLRSIANQSLNDLAEHGQLVTDLSSAIDKAEDESVITGKKKSLELHEESMFNTLAGRYFESGRRDALKNLLTQATTDDTLTDEQRTNAKKKLDSLPALESEYIDLKNKHGRKSNVQGLWTNTQRRKGLTSYLNEANATKEKAFDRVSELLETEGVKMDTSIKEQASLIADISAIEKQLELMVDDETIDPSLKRMVRKDLKEKQDRLNNIQLGTAESESLQNNIADIQKSLDDIQGELTAELDKQVEFTASDVASSVMEGSELNINTAKAEADLAEATDENRAELQTILDGFKSTLETNTEAYRAQAEILNNAEIAINERKSKQEALLAEKKAEREKAIKEVIDTAPFQGLINSLTSQVDAKVAHAMLTRQFYDSTDAKQIKKRQKESVSNLTKFINELDDNMSKEEFEEFSADIRRIASRTSLTDKQRVDIETKLQNRTVEYNTYQAISKEDKEAQEKERESYLKAVERRRKFKSMTFMKRLFSKPKPKSMEAEEINYFNSLYSPAKIAESYTREQIIEMSTAAKKELEAAKERRDTSALSISDDVGLDNHLKTLYTVASLTAYTNALQKSIYVRDVLDIKEKAKLEKALVELEKRNKEDVEAAKLKTNRLLTNYKATGDVITDDDGSTFDMSSFDISPDGQVSIEVWSKDGEKKNKLFKGEVADELELLHTIWEISVLDGEVKVPNTTRLDKKTDKALLIEDAKLAKRKAVLESTLHRKKKTIASRAKVIRSDMSRNLKNYLVAIEDGMPVTIDQQEAFTFSQMSEEVQKEYVKEKINITDTYTLQAIGKLSNQRKKIATTIKNNRLRRKAKKDGKDDPTITTTSETPVDESQDNEREDFDFEKPQGRTEEVIQLEKEINTSLNDVVDLDIVHDDIKSIVDSGDASDDIKDVSEEIDTLETKLEDVKSKPTSEEKLQEVFELTIAADAIRERAENSVKAVVNSVTSTPDDYVLPAPDTGTSSDLKNKKTEHGEVLYGTSVDESLNITSRKFGTGLYKDFPFYKWAQKPALNKNSARFKLSSGKETNKTTGDVGTYMYATLVNDNNEFIDENGNVIEEGDTDRLIRAVVWIVGANASRAAKYEFVNENEVYVTPETIGKGSIYYTEDLDQKITSLTNVKPKNMIISVTQVTTPEHKLKGGVTVLKSGLRHADGSEHTILANQRHITDEEVDILFTLYDAILSKEDTSIPSKLSTDLINDLKALGIEGLTFSEIQKLIVYSGARGIDNSSRFNLNIQDRTFELKNDLGEWQEIKIGDNITRKQKEVIKRHLKSLRVNVNKDFLNKLASESFTWRGKVIERGDSLNNLFITDGGDHISHLGTNIKGFDNGTGIKTISPRPNVYMDMSELDNQIQRSVSIKKPYVNKQKTEQVIIEKPIAEKVKEETPSSDEGDLLVDKYITDTTPPAQRETITKVIEKSNRIKLTVDKSNYVIDGKIARRSSNHNSGSSGGNFTSSALNKGNTVDVMIEDMIAGVPMSVALENAVTESEETAKEMSDVGETQYINEDVLTSIANSFQEVKKKLEAKGSILLPQIKISLLGINQDTGGEVMVAGALDITVVNKDGSIDIIDVKTKNGKGEDIEIVKNDLTTHEGYIKQQNTYALALQQQGLTVNRISLLPYIFGRVKGLSALGNQITAVSNLDQIPLPLDYGKIKELYNRNTPVNENKKDLTKLEEYDVVMVGDKSFTVTDINEKGIFADNVQIPIDKITGIEDDLGVVTSVKIDQDHNIISEC